MNFDRPNSDAVYTTSGPLEFYLHDKYGSSQPIYGLKRRTIEQFETTYRHVEQRNVHQNSSDALAVHVYYHSQNYHDQNGYNQSCHDLNAWEYRAIARRGYDLDCGDDWLLLVGEPGDHDMRQ